MHGSFLFRTGRLDRSGSWLHLGADNWTPPGSREIAMTALSPLACPTAPGSCHRSYRYARVVRPSTPAKQPTFNAEESDP